MLSDYHALNSFSEEYIKNYEKMKNIAHEGAKTIKVQCLLLADIIRIYCGNKFPDYFDLDVEGLDDEVVASYNFTSNGPRIMCVESHSEVVRKQMLSQGYIQYFSTIHNVIYIRKELVDTVLHM